MKIKIWSPELEPLGKQMLSTKYVDCERCGIETIEIETLGKYARICRLCEIKDRNLINDKNNKTKEESNES